MTTGQAGSGAVADAMPSFERSARSEAPLRVRAARGSVWLVAGFGVAQVLRLASNLVVAHYLAPEAFGMMALVLVLLQGLSMFSDIGVGQSIVRHERGEDQRFLDTAWTLQVIRGLVLAAIAIAAAVPYARFYSNPMLAPLIVVASLGTIASGFNSTSLYTGTRRLDVGRMTLCQLGVQVVSTAVTIAWVMIDATVWALVAGHVVSSVARALASRWFLPRGRNRFAWDREARAEIMGFGRWVMVSTVGTFLAAQGDRMILGKLAGTSALGVYAIAVLLSSFALQLVQQLGQYLVFPVYAAVLNQGRSLPALFLRVRRPLVLGGGVLLTGMVGAGPATVEMLYSDEYRGAGWMLQALAVSGWFQVLSVTTGSALLAMGEARAVAGGNLVKLCGLGVLIPAGWYAWGFPGAIAGLALADGAKYLMLGVQAQSRGLPVFWSDAGLTAAFAACAGASWATARGVSHLGWPPVATVAVVGAATVAMWAPMALHGLGSWREMLGGRVREAR